MPFPLNDPKTFATHDGSDAHGSITLLPEQCTQAWSEVTALTFPSTYRACKQVVICGMGGSGLGGHIVDSVFGPELKVPLLHLNGYALPAWVKNDTLLLVVSYSGGTEEMLTLLKHARTRKCRVVVIASGGKLAAVAKRAKLPCYVFDDTKTNPARMPRMGIGLTLFAELGILKQLGYLSLSDKAVKVALQQMLTWSDAWERSVTQNKNLAKKVATALHGHMPIFLASEHLSGNAQTARNQTHETAKSYSDWHAVPEVNHHLMEGLQHPAAAKHLQFVLFESDLYHPRNQARMGITARVIKKNGIGVQRITLPGSTCLEQALAALQFTGYVSFYLGMLYNIDPTPIPWVDYFKEQLA